MSKIYQKMYLTNKNRSKGILSGFIGNVILRCFYSESYPISFNRAGFTLIELLVVVLIIGILSAVALPQYTRAVERSRVAEAEIALRHLRDLQSMCFLANSNSLLCSNGDFVENMGETLPQSKYFTYVLSQDAISAERDSGEELLYTLGTTAAAEGAQPGGSLTYEANVISCIDGSMECKEIGYTKQNGSVWLKP